MRKVQSPDLYHLTVVMQNKQQDLDSIYLQIIDEELEGDTKTSNCSESSFPVFFKIKASCLSRLMNNTIQYVL